MVHCVDYICVVIVLSTVILVHYFYIQITATDYV